MTTEAEGGTRKDAVRNRARLVAAARQVYGERGHEVPLEDVASAAGVSRTTLYRHFSTREQLAAVVFEENVALIEQQARSVAGEPDGVIKLFDYVVDMQMQNQGLGRALAGADEDWFRTLSDRVAAAFEPLLANGLENELVQDWVTSDDILLAFHMASSALVGAQPALRARMRAQGLRLLHRGLFG